MFISSLALKLWPFPFIKDWPEIWKPEYPVWVLPNIWRLGRVRNTKFVTSQIKRYWILKNGRVTAFTVCELLRENHKRVTVLQIWSWFEDQLPLVGRLSFFFFFLFIVFLTCVYSYNTLLFICFIFNYPFFLSFKGVSFNFPTSLVS